MAYLDWHFFSETLGKQVSAYVILPQKTSSAQIGVATKKTDGKFPCLYLLHGLSDDHTIWMRRTSIERFSEEYGIAVVMADGARSFYTDMKDGSNYFTFFTEELPRLCETFFPISSAAEDRYIAGNSMGGYGALKMALSHPDRYAAAAGLSSVADIRVPYFPQDYRLSFGETIADKEDLFYLADQLADGAKKPRLYMLIGRSDGFYEDNLRLKAHLQNLKFDLTYQESDGGHTWDFWDRYIREILTWMFDKGEQA